MNSWKQFAVWLVICAGSAGATMALVTMLDKSFGLQKTVSHYGTKKP